MESLTFAEMWNLAETSNVVSTGGEFSTELLMAIFWEETQFKNIEQINFKKGGKLQAIGFGQVQGESMDVVNALYKARRHIYSRGAILENESWSVDLTVDYLRHLRTGGTSSTKRSILCKYASGQPESTAPPGMLATVNSWLTCEKTLKSANGNFTAEVILKALKSASPASSQRGNVPPEIADGGYSSVWGF